MKRKNVELFVSEGGGSSAEDSSAQLARRWRSGDQSAFEKIVERYRGPLLSYAISRVRHLQDSEDIVQDTFLRAHRSVKQLKDENKLWLWLKQIAHNSAVDLLKRALRMGDSTDPQEFDQIENNKIDFAQKISLQDIIEVIEGFSETYRETAIYYYLEEWPYSQIAETLNLEPAAVRQRISRINRLLREALGRKS
ncbi:MAG TPA: sigma-70 family RNA polymerase sigma factor [Acidobacteriota bacterium]|nr:sigma-70 family RNA polymerase sigma factor [Acidobacteriota bacterium]